MDESVDRLGKRLEGYADTGAPFNVWGELGQMTMEVVGNAAFG